MSSIAVWIRLNELPIEHYDVEALQHIGRAIGTVLRVDTFTATETRGRFARLCVQIDVDKLLITAVMIGNLEQTVSYEGIQSCPYTIRHEPPSREVSLEAGVDEGEGSHDSCEANSPKSEMGPIDQERGGVQEEGHASTYGPWVVVARTKNGTKMQRNGWSPPSQRNDRNGGVNGNMVMEVANMQGRDMVGLANGLGKENKRKLCPPRFLKRAHVENVIQKIGKDVMKQAQPNPFQNNKSNTLSLVSARIDLSQQKHKSVKDKKVLARQRVSQPVCSSAVDSGVGKESRGEQLKGNAVKCLKVGRICDGEANNGALSQFQFKAAA